MSKAKWYNPTRDSSWDGYYKVVWIVILVTTSLIVLGFVTGKIRLES